MVLNITVQRNPLDAPKDECNIKGCDASITSSRPPVYVILGDYICDRDNLSTNAYGGGGGGRQYTSLTGETLSNINDILTRICSALENLDISLSIKSK